MTWLAEVVDADDRKTDPVQRLRGRRMRGRRYDTWAACQPLHAAFEIEGRFTLSTADATSRTRSPAASRYSVSEGFHPVGETHGTVLGSDFVTEHASVAGVSPFSLPGGFSFTVNPGDSFYVLAAMTAVSITNIAHQADGTVDALHTLAGHFTGGDISLLAPATVAAVPEVPILPILAAGLLAMAGRLRRRRR